MNFDLILLIMIFEYDFRIHAKHFNGGTIRWEPISTSINSSFVSITIIQSYSWSFPRIQCASDVPISTSGRSNEMSDLICVADCSTDGGYSAKPVSILTDCISASSSLGMMQSQRAVNITLNISAHFYLSHVGSAWVALNDGQANGLQWSITTFIDLRLRSDGVINTPPIANVISPQYAIVNTLTKIRIPVSDANGDDVRCRWATYTPGDNGIGKRSVDFHHLNKRHDKTNSMHKSIGYTEQFMKARQRRFSSSCFLCGNTCWKDCRCRCNACQDTTCMGDRCNDILLCVPVSTVSTTEIPGTIASTLSYAVRQPIDECGGICYPNSLPNETSISNCTISFLGLTADRWYGVALQVEDFMDATSTTPMSSVPVQFLIYVMPTPACSQAPLILALDCCMEVLIGVSISFTVYVLNPCDPNESSVEDLILTTHATGIKTGVLADVPTNRSMSYMNMTWTPQVNQNGSQELCLIAFNSDNVQSEQYCTTFMVVPFLDLCKPTTTSTTTTTMTTSTTTSVTSTISTTTMTTKHSVNQPNWLLILGLSLLMTLMALCFCLMWYWYLCGPGSWRRRRQQEQKQQIYRHNKNDKIHEKRSTAP